MVGRTDLKVYKGASLNLNGDVKEVGDFNGVIGKLGGFPDLPKSEISESIVDDVYGNIFKIIKEKSE